MRLPILRLIAALIPALGVLNVQSNEWWPRFRGPGGQGIASSSTPPISFGVGDAQWKSVVPPGHSSPSIWDNRIFLSCFTAGRLECRAYDRRTGRLAWSKPVPTGKIQSTHDFNNPAASTPVADSERVTFYLAPYGLLTFSHAGELIWEKPLTNALDVRYGSGTSPIRHGDLVILTLDAENGASKIAAYRAATGELAWETPRPLFTSSWSTPVIWRASSEPELIVAGSLKLMAYNPENGSPLWSVSGFPSEVATSPTFDEVRIYVGSAATGGGANSAWDGTTWRDLQALDANKDGMVQRSEVPDDYRLVQRPELPDGHPGRILPIPLTSFFNDLDQDKNGAISETEWALDPPNARNPVLMALRPGSSRSKETPKMDWEAKRGMPEVPSPLSYLGHLFVVRDGGIVQCLDSSTGTTKYQERLGAGGGYSASPVGADGRVYLCSQSGVVTVIDARADTLTVLARNIIGEQITATPALVARALYVRTDRHLYSFGQ